MSQRTRSNEKTVDLILKRVSMFINRKECGQTELVLVHQLTKQLSFLLRFLRVLNFYIKFISNESAYRNQMYSSFLFLLSVLNIWSK